jgi:four helix bundle protein
MFICTRWQPDGQVLKKSRHFGTPCSGTATASASAAASATASASGSLRRGDMVISGSFRKGWVVDGWPDVKDKPASEAGRRTTLDIGSPIDFRRVMNDPEVTMHDTPPDKGLIAHSTALKAAGLTLALVRRVQSPFRSLADQVIRSAASVPANLSEGHGRVGRDRFNHWRIAYASAKEVDTHLRLMADARVVDRARAEVALELFDRVRAMTWRLLHPIS